jgi:hypothetical protein
MDSPFSDPSSTLQRTAGELALSNDYDTNAAVTAEKHNLD